MDTTRAETLQWSKRVESSSAVRDPLGLWGHLQIQVDFVPGITSVTDRIRYYTNLAWFWKHLSGKINLGDFERIFILKCLSHHDGKARDNPHLDDIFNKTRFESGWNQRKVFDLEFTISGFGRSYYNSQLEVLRCAWTDFAGNVQLSRINDKLASCLDRLKPEDFLHKQFSKDFLKQRLNGFCVCDSETNAREVDIMSKLFFGFFSSQDGEWDIDEREYEDFLRGDLDLDFERTAQTTSPEIVLENVSLVRTDSLRRRNTLFLFLKMIDETHPPGRIEDLRRTVWDATYFRQNRRTKRFIEFGRLERVRVYWEYFQLNVYYVFALEKTLNAIEILVKQHPGIEKDKLVDDLKRDVFTRAIAELLGASQKDLSVSELFKEVWRKNSADRTLLSSPINESTVYDELADAETPEEMLAFSLVMLVLLRKRYEMTDTSIRNYGTQERQLELYEDKLRIEKILGALLEESGERSLFEYLNLLIDQIVERHLLESAMRLSASGTTNWIFAEEEGCLTPARQDQLDIRARDNRWDSILHLLRDTQFVVDSGSIGLTQRGTKWLRLIE